MESGPAPTPALRFQRLAEIAVGATARVELSRITEGPMLGRHVVVKRLHPHVADDPQFVDMFRDEAWMTGSLRNPHVVEVVGFGTDDAGPYLAVEFVRGVSLARLMKTVFETREMFTERLVVHLGASICDGLHAAHELRSPAGEWLGLVHRDVTPSNVLVGFDGMVKLADFGLAKAKLRLTKTVTGLLKGQPYYMAPEQVQSRAVDRRADVFAVGVLLFELFAGRRPWDAANDLEAMRASCEQPPADLLQLRPRIDVALVRLVNRCLEKAPDARFQTAGELRDVLGKWLEVHGYRTDNEVALARFIRRNAMRQMRWFDRALAGHFVARRAERLDRIGNDPPATQEDVTRPDVQPARFTPSQPPLRPPRPTSVPPPEPAREEAPEVEAHVLGEVEETDAELFDTDDGPTLIQRSAKARQVLRRLSDALGRPRGTDAGAAPPTGATAATALPGSASRPEVPRPGGGDGPDVATVRDQSRSAVSNSPVEASAAAAAAGPSAGEPPGRVVTPDPAAPPLPSSAVLSPAPTAVLPLPVSEPPAAEIVSWEQEIALAAQGLAAQAGEAAEHARWAAATAAAAARAAAVAQQAVELARQARRDEAAHLLREAYRLQAALVRGEAEPLAPSPTTQLATPWPATVPEPTIGPWAGLRDRLERWLGPRHTPVVAVAVAVAGVLLVLVLLLVALATC